MKSIQFTLLFNILFSTFSFNANAYYLADANSKLFCGPYKYEIPNSNHTVADIPLFLPTGMIKGLDLAQEYAHLRGLVGQWFTFFEGNGDNTTRFKNFCIGFYDDANSTGLNAFAYGDQGILVGTELLSLTKFNIDRIVQGTYMKENPGAPLPQGLSGDKARDMIYLHELSHLIQKLHHQFYASADGTVKNNELHADCSAGLLFATASILNKTMNEKDGWVNASVSAAMLAYGLGEHSTSVQHHGTPTERMSAFMDGVSMAVNMQNGFLAGYPKVNALKTDHVISACESVLK